MCITNDQTYLLFQQHYGQRKANCFLSENQVKIFIRIVLILGENQKAENGDLQKTLFCKIIYTPVRVSCHGYPWSFMYFWFADFFGIVKLSFQHQINSILKQNPQFKVHTYFVGKRTFIPPCWLWPFFIENCNHEMYMQMFKCYHW